ncbi:MAG: hypothetical protein QNJ33_00970 [Crocosphaera sp.]|nr:hypothetical protein [Crocosphaera sp.]
MLAVKNIDSIKQFRKKLEPHGIKIWNSSESLPEEILQQLIGNEEDSKTDKPRAEELHPKHKIDELSNQKTVIKIDHFIDVSPRTINVGFLLGNNGISYPVALSHVGAVSVAFNNGRWRETGNEKNKKSKKNKKK